MFIIDHLNQFVQIIADIVGIFAAMLIMAGVLHGVMLALKVTLIKHSDDFDQIRLVVGQYLLLGLEFLIGKDILETIVEPSFVDLGALVVLIVIRVLLNYFLILDIEGRHDFMFPFKSKKKK